MFWTQLSRILSRLKPWRKIKPNLPNVLVLYSSTDKRGRHDATGAFIPAARAFKDLHKVPDENFVGLDLENTSKEWRRGAVYRAFHDASIERSIDVVAVFCHGWPYGIQLGFDTNQVGGLAALCYRKCSKDAKFVFYACLVAENDVRDDEIDEIGPATDGGFCDAFRDSLVRYDFRGGWVDGHKTKGHTVWNPFVVRFLCQDTDDLEYDLKGGAWLVSPASEYWPKWVRHLRPGKSKLRYEFPLMSELAVKLKLEGMSI